MKAIEVKKIGNGNRVEWQEHRGEDGQAEMFYIIAEKIGNCWTFAQRSSWETSFYPLEATAEIIAIAESAT